MLKMSIYVNWIIKVLTKVLTEHKVCMSETVCIRQILFEDFEKIWKIDRDWERRIYKGKAFKIFTSLPIFCSWLAAEKHLQDFSRYMKKHTVNKPNVDRKVKDLSYYDNRSLLKCLGLSCDKSCHYDRWNVLVQEITQILA